MATIAEMLHRDENGRFTTSGKGESVSDALESISRAEQEQRDAAERAAHAHDVVRLIDRDKRLCGCYELQQTWDLPEQLSKDGDVITINGRPASERRLALLRRSFENPSLTPEQSAEVAAEVDEILSARIGRAVKRDSRDVAASSDDPGRSELYVTRDKHGLYLGMYTLPDACRRWAKSELHGAVINTQLDVSFKVAADTTRMTIPEMSGYSSKVDESLRVAKEFVYSVRRKGKGYWQQRKAFTYRVLYRSDEPVCSVPYSCLRSAFEDAWIVIGRRDVQLVTTWSSKEVEERAIRAVQQAKGEYHEIAAPGSMCLTEEEFNNREARRAEEERALREMDALRSSWNSRRVTRDECGCLLGVFTIDEAMSLWPQAFSDSTVIVVPHMVEFADAVSSISHTKSFETTYNLQQYRRAVSEAAALPAKLVKLSAGTFWQSISEKRLSVRNNSSRVIARLKPAEITEAFGNRWFLVSQDDAQVMTTSSADKVSSRARLIESRAYGDAEQGDVGELPSDAVESAAEARRAARQKARAANEVQVPQSRSEGLRPAKPQSKPKAYFYVYAVDGKAVYHCKKERGDRVRKYLLRTLPGYSNRQVSDGIRLTVPLRELGFSNTSQFVHLCAVAAKGSEPTLSDSSGRKAPTVSLDQVSFDGPEHVLYVFRGILSCERRKHKLEAATGIIATLKGRSVSINVNYCHNCKKYFLSQSEYEHYRDSYGPILGNFSFYDYGSDYREGFDGLAPRSLLNLCGYNVKQESTLTNTDRHLILANVMDRDICSKPKVMSHLQWLIRTHEKNSSMWLACEKWREDLDWVRAYNINRQRRFAIGSVQRYR